MLLRIALGAALGLANQEYDLAFVHPAHVSMAEIKARRYQDAVPIKQSIVAARVPIDTQAKIRQTLQNLREVRGGREALEAVGYRGFFAPNPEVATATIEWLGL